MSSYDAIVIGAGMSGLAAAIRLQMFGMKVVLLEKHAIAGGLNSYYQRRNLELGGVRPFDVGLHALTNFIKKGERGKPFSKLLKQLRLSWDEFKLNPQTYSVIRFSNAELRFSNDFALLEQEVSEKFPRQREAFALLVQEVRAFNELDLSLGHTSARAKLASLISDPLLLEMLLCPLLIYGSAWEDDMDFAQFVVMFKSLYFEGFSRPEGGVRTIIELLLKRYRDLGGELRFKAGVEKILTHRGSCVGVLLQSGEELRAEKIFSSMGLPETYARLDQASSACVAKVGEMSFLESIFVYDRKPSMEETIVFYNQGPRYHYRKAQELFDPRSAVICFPDNYHRHETSGEGTIRVTSIANYERWKALPREEYLAQKEVVAQHARSLIAQQYPDFEAQLRFTDVFSPTTIERYTWHLKGTVYGSTDKRRDGTTAVENLFIIGTDQGFLGIVGAILSGISMANLHGLMGQEAT